MDVEERVIAIAMEARALARRGLTGLLLTCAPHMAMAQAYDCNAPRQGKELLMHMAGGTITAAFHIVQPPKRRADIAANILAGLIGEYGDGVARLALLEPDAAPIIVRQGTTDKGIAKWMFIITRTPNEGATASSPLSIRQPLETRCFSMDYGHQLVVKARCSTDYIDLMEFEGVMMEMSWTDERGIEKIAETALATVQDLKNQFVALYEQHKRRCSQK